MDGPTKKFSDMVDNSSDICYDLSKLKRFNKTIY